MSFSTTTTAAAEAAAAEARADAVCAAEDADPRPEGCPEARFDRFRARIRALTLSAAGNTVAD